MSVSGPPPEHGELFERSYRIGNETVELLAEIAIDGPNLHLRDVAVFPAGSRRAAVGATAVLRVLRSELLPELRSLGFTLVRITGTRLSGSGPGRSLDLTIEIPEEAT